VAFYEKKSVIRRRENRQNDIKDFCSFNVVFGQLSISDRFAHFKIYATVRSKLSSSLIIMTVLIRIIRALGWCKQ